MGLCKCPKRQITNQFCFEHRVNVCEHCMVKKHPKCVVQSYLQWLQDSDYDPNCSLCHQDLAEEPCVRLVCYHLFHWVCLDRGMRELPPNTAPAGYTCPTCSDCIFPTEKLVSPVADNLRQLLSDVNWARAGLGMPLLEDRVEKKPTFHSVPPSGPRPTPEGESGSVTMDGKSDSVIQFDMHTSPTSRISRTMPTSPLLLPNDADEDKYRRRSPLRFIARWWRTTFGTGLMRTKRMTKGQRVLMWIFVAILLLLSLIVILNSFARSEPDYDDLQMNPMLDPMNNPNIHVNKHA